MQAVSIFGAGFILGKFAETYSDTAVIERDGLLALSPNVLYGISTVHNYHPKDGDVFIDVETNLTHFLRVLRSLEEFWGTALMFNLVSTWFIFDGKHIPASEDDCSEQHGFYSITSKCREQLLKSYAELKGFKYRILRLGNVIGVGDKKISRKKNALQHIIREIAQGRDVDYLYKGGAIRDFIDVRDCVRAIRLVLEKGNLNETYNIANGLGLNVNDLVEVAHRETGFKSKVTMIDVPEFHRQVQTPKMVLDVRKLKSLGYVQQHDIKQSVRELVHHYQNEPTENT